jgi:hypothetical protein
MPSAWNMFVKKVYEEGKAKDSSYEFKQALVDASKRKSEMGSASAAGVKKHKTAKRGRGKKTSTSLAGGRRTRRRHSRRHRR